jgi:hypothetical protein
VEKVTHRLLLARINSVVWTTMTNSLVPLLALAEESAVKKADALAIGMEVAMVEIGMVVAMVEIGMVVATVEIAAKAVAVLTETVVAVLTETVVAWLA